MTRRKRILLWLFGNGNHQTLEKRLLIIITFYTTVIALLGNILNFFLDFNHVLIATTLAANVVVAILYIIARNTNYHMRIVLPLYLLSVLFLSVNWFLNGGFDGNTINFIFVYFVGLYALLPARFKIFGALGYLFVFIVLFLIQHVYPALIVGYQNTNQRFSDLFFGNILYFLLIFSIIDIIIRSYSREFMRTEEVNQKLLLKNLESEIHLRKLRHSEDRFRSIANQIPDVLYLTDNKGTITYLSPATSLVFGWSPDEMIGQPFINFLYEHEIPRAMQAFMDAQRTNGITKELPLIIKHKSGMLKPVELNGTNFRQDNEIVGSIGIIRDVTERKKLEIDLIKAKEKAEESDRLKSAFLANMSHEIRTPLNGIIGFTTLLSKDDVTSEKKEKYSAIMRSSAQSLLKIINDILDISKIEAGQIEIQMAPCDVSSLLSELYTLYTEKVKTSHPNHQVNIELLPFSELVILSADEARLRQVLINLLDNALKFTDEGVVRFGIVSASDQWVEIVVSDTGEGISKEMQPHVFDRFRQAKNSANHTGGNGLGLAIVKQLLDLMGGSIRLESEEDKGSTFRIRLRIDHVQQASDSYLNTKTDLQNRSTLPQILLVEDDVNSCVFMEEMLRISGFGVEIAPDAQSARQKLSSRTYNLILMDIRLPDADGLDLVREIRTTDKRVPIIAQTAYAMYKDEERALAAGCNGYISKPVNMDKLIEQIDRLLK